MVFDTSLDGCGAVLITLWERDQSDDEWYTELGQALNEVVKTMQLSADFSSLVPGLDLYGHLHTALSFLATIWEAMRNKTT
ncbi:hypothetical protein ACIGQE_27480 [Streptomyces sp. NPDC053429]|uniref:hypothetical protein n=1 Tax=Streptomyces sp. NPDC053429 TaxID=3365702 RepID=UPI0037D568C2